MMTRAPPNDDFARSQLLFKGRKQRERAIMSAAPRLIRLHKTIRRKLPLSAHVGSPFVFFIGILLLGSAYVLSGVTSGPCDEMESQSFLRHGVTGYELAARYPIDPEAGGWSGKKKWFMGYPAIDSEARRLYVTQGDRVIVVDADSGRVVGQVKSTPHVQDVVIAQEFHRGFTSNAGNNTVTIFDTDTLSVINTAKVEGGPIGFAGSSLRYILYDSFSKRIFPFGDNKATVLDAETGRIAGKLIFSDGSPEAAVSDGAGTLYVLFVQPSAVAVVDTKTLTVRRTYPIESVTRPCLRPHAVSYDTKEEALYIGCSDTLIALRAPNGKFLADSYLCAGTNADGFDPEDRLIFESCETGVVSVLRPFSDGVGSFSIRMIDAIPTQLQARSMVFDRKTKNVYLPVIDLRVVSEGGRANYEWNGSSLAVLVLSKCFRAACR